MITIKRKMMEQVNTKPGNSYADEITDFLIQCKWKLVVKTAWTKTFKRGLQELHINFEHKTCHFLYHDRTVIKFEDETYDNYLMSFIKYI